VGQFEISVTRDRILNAAIALIALIAPIEASSLRSGAGASVTCRAR
jgi:hypothetical protein